MNNDNSLKSNILRKISNLMLGYPEFAFFFKVIIAVLVLGLAFVILRLFLN